MKEKITSFIMTLLTILMMAILFFLSMVIYDEFKREDVVGNVQEFVSNITISSGVKKESIQTPEIIEINVDEEKTISNESYDYNSEDTNNFFYKQLDDYSKIIYKALEMNKENMKTGNYEINLGSVFSDLLSQEDGEEILGRYYQSAIESFSYDNPDVFYIDYSKLFLNIETTTRGIKKTYRVFINSGDRENYFAKEFQSKGKIDVAISEMEKLKSYFVQNKKDTEYENIKLVHDYIVDSIEYDQTISEDNIYNLYGALINKVSVCEGYAKAFKYLMDAIDIPCVIVIGEGTNSDGKTESHAWNYVQINNVWYAVDCTWDDPIIVGAGFVGYGSKYKYFLKGEKEFNKTHIPNGQFTKNGRVFTFPELSANNY